MSAIPTIALVGRTNVGKSTLFNVLAGKQLSVVDDYHGVTRDRHYSLVTRFERPFTLIDTGGIVGSENDPLAEQVRTQALVAIQEADLVVAIFDGIAGLQGGDAEVVDTLRRAQKPVLWVVNKCEKELHKLSSAEFYELGIEELVPVSAAHRHGIKDLAAEIVQRGYRAMASQRTMGGAERRAEVPEVKIAVVGKPNAGKSTLINALLGEDRLVTSPIAGTTRDSIDVRLRRDDTDFVLIDTAGLRKKAKVSDLSIERFSNIRALRSLAESDVAVLMLDATEGIPTEQDTKIAALAHERGRCLIIVVNKWDAIERDNNTAEDYRSVLRQVFNFVPYAPILFVSAHTGKRVETILAKAREVYDKARARVPTGELNRVLTRAWQSYQPPVYRGQPIKLFFATQVRVAPPTFVLFCNHPQKLDFAYERYIKNQLRESFDYEGSDIKLIFRKRGERSEVREERNDDNSAALSETPENVGTEESAR